MRGLTAGVVMLAGCEGIVSVPQPGASGAPDEVRLRAVARAVDNYLANYGTWSPEAIEIARRYQLVIAHPGRTDISRAQIAAIQAGVDPDDPDDNVIVLCYVSAGEDLRTASLTEDEIRADRRFRGNGNGPRIDPRGPDADGGSLGGIDPRGIPSSGGTGFASYYLDDNDVDNSPTRIGDGFPDRNKIYGSLFVNAGDPDWFNTLDAMTLDGPDGLPGLREILTNHYGRGLACDGVFLDTIDTASPNSYSSATSSNQSEFEWTGPGFAAFIRQIRKVYPNKLILQNRGLFYFTPGRPQYELSTRGAIDFLMFESFRLNSSSSEEFHPNYYPDNRYNVAPKLMAEANRPDGFKVLSMGYAEGPPETMAQETLTGGSTLGYESLLEDIRVAEELNGFRHYLTDASLHVVNDFVRTNARRDDHTPPRWSSTYNDHASAPASEPTPRIGLQAATANANGDITVRWDVALDMNTVRYVLYVQPVPFAFDVDRGLSGARRIPLDPRVPADYLKGTGPGRFPYEATVPGFRTGQTQYLLLRAVDASPAANEDDNQVVLSLTP